MFALEISSVLFFLISLKFIWQIRKPIDNLDVETSIISPQRCISPHVKRGTSETPIATEGYAAFP